MKCEPYSVVLLIKILKLYLAFVKKLFRLLVCITFTSIIFILQTFQPTKMRSFVIFAVGLALVLALAECNPVESTEEDGEQLSMANENLMENGCK
jgi:hypothetical protein